MPSFKFIVEERSFDESGILKRWALCSEYGKLKHAGFAVQRSGIDRRGVDELHHCWLHVQKFWLRVEPNDLEALAFSVYSGRIFEPNQYRWRLPDESRTAALIRHGRAFLNPERVDGEILFGEFRWSWRSWIRNNPCPPILVEKYEKFEPEDKKRKK